MSDFKPCWSFCTPDCKLRQADGCRRSIPRFDLSPPNEGVDHVMYLKFGRQDYEDSPEVKQWSSEQVEWWGGNRTEPAPVHWRQRVRDNWAGIEIWQDPESKPTPDNGYQRRRLYDPMRLQELLLETPRMIRVVHHAIEQDGDSMSMRRVQKELLSFFRNEFKQDWLAGVGGVSTGNSEANWPRTFKFLEHCVELFGNFLLLNYELNPLEWSVRVMQYGEPSDRWKEHLERVDLLHKPKKIERVMTPPVIQGTESSLVSEDEEVYVKGLVYDE
jgi:hypothetical protein